MRALASSAVYQASTRRAVTDASAPGKAGLRWCSTALLYSRTVDGLRFALEWASQRSAASANVVPRVPRFGVGLPSMYLACSVMAQLWRLTWW